MKRISLELMDTLPFQPSEYTIECVVHSAFPHPCLCSHVEAFSQPGAMTAAINYYRAILLHWGALGGTKATQVRGEPPSVLCVTAIQRRLPCLHIR